MAAAKTKRKAEVLSSPKHGVTKPAASKKRAQAMPPSLTAAQKAAVQQFVGLTQTDKTTAAKLLKSSNWDVQSAANSYFSGSSNAASNSHRTKLSKLFDQYRDNPKEEPDEINMDGMSNMLGALGISLENVQLLIFSELVQSPTLGNITRQGFVDGLSQAGASDATKIKSLVLAREASIASDRALLRKVYKYTFIIARPTGQKAVALDQATEFWRLLLGGPPSLAWSTPDTPWLDWWIEFLLDRWKKSVNKDMWDQTLSFAERTLEDEQLSFWSEDSAWPGVIDEFVEWVGQKRSASGAMDTS